MAERFRSGRVFLAGDAAHLMPVWQGQGYNSGIRDALNVSWKLAMVLRGRAGDGLLETYEAERREHVRAMIMPAMTRGALTRAGSADGPTPVGRLFIQPTVTTRQSPSVKLDDVLGPWFALLVWNNDPRAILDDDARARLERAGVRLVAARPAVQLGWRGAEPDDDGVLVVGDLDGALKRWFEAHAESVVLLRPDRIVGGASRAYAASDMVRGFDRAVGAPDPGPEPGPAPLSAPVPEHVS
jgi:3-(3-hydroxy-phenyl)propionate hydroxylase